MAQTFWEKLKTDAREFGEGIKEGFEKEALKQQEATQNYHDLFAWADGSLIALPEKPEDGQKNLLCLHIHTQRICAPCTGIFEGVDAQTHTLLMESDGGLELGLRMEGENPCKGLGHLLVKPGEKITQGQPIIEFEQPVEMDSRLIEFGKNNQSQAKPTVRPQNGVQEVRMGDRILPNDEAE